MAVGQSRRGLFALVLVAALFSFTLFISSRRHASRPFHEEVASETLLGDVMAPKLGNETIKAELGRASWKLLHTIMAKYPDLPSEDERDALRSYIFLFARLYPCGECALHFQQLLAKFPPQIDSRSSAAAWACHVHNQVNKSLKKELFDCSKIGDFYDCGCAGDEKKPEPTQSTVEPLKLEKEGWTRGG